MRLGWLACCVLVFGPGVAGCEVSLVEGHDPEISRGLSQYQEALETFTLQVLDDYQRCGFGREHLKEIRSTNCSAEPGAAREVCRARVDSQVREVSAKTDAACAAARYEANTDTFYFPNEGLLRVLLVRARVLDAGGTCVYAIEGAKELARSVTDPELRAWVSSAEAGNNANNCTEVSMQQILNNHRELQTQHRRLDALDKANGTGPAQAQLVLPLSRDTLEQNIEIALFLEEAKKRGAQ